MPINNLRLVLIDSQTIALDLHYQLSVGNSVGHNYIRTAYSTGAAEIVEQNLVMVPDAVDNEQIIMTAEWMSPPLMLGVEYRTTERYQGKPVYAKAVSLGAGPDTGTKKLIAHNITNIADIVDFGGSMIGTTGAVSLPGVSASADDVYEFGVNYSRFVWAVGSNATLTGYTGTGWVKYTKTTD